MAETSWKKFVFNTSNSLFSTLNINKYTYIYIYKYIYYIHIIIYIYDSQDV